MNMELMERVAQWLEAGAPHEVSGGMGFDMQYIGSDISKYRIEPREWNNPACGTVGCIAGAINQFAGNNILTSDEGSAIKALGLDPDDDVVCALFDQLFYPPSPHDDDFDWDQEKGYYDASPKEVARVVRHFMNTGEVDWDKAFED